MERKITNDLSNPVAAIVFYKRSWIAKVQYYKKDPHWSLPTSLSGRMIPFKFCKSCHY